MDKMPHHCPFQNCIALFYTTPPIFFIALQSWSSRNVIQFLNLVSKYSPRQCSDPSVLKKFRWDSILACMKCLPLPFSKLYFTFLCNSPNYFFLHFKVGQVDMLYNF